MNQHKCIMCTIDLVEDRLILSVAPLSEGARATTWSIPNGSHCPRCGLKYYHDSLHDIEPLREVKQ